MNHRPLGPEPSALPAAPHPVAGDDGSFALQLAPALQPVTSGRRQPSFTLRAPAWYRSTFSRVSAERNDLICFRGKGGVTNDVRHLHIVFYLVVRDQSACPPRTCWWSVDAGCSGVREACALLPVGHAAFVERDERANAGPADREVGCVKVAATWVEWTSALFASHLLPFVGCRRLELRVSCLRGRSLAI